MFPHPYGYSISVSSYIVSIIYYGEFIVWTYGNENTLLNADVDLEFFNLWAPVFLVLCALIFMLLLLFPAKLLSQLDWG
jgi:hypothetical protein